MSLLQGLSLSIQPCAPITLIMGYDPMFKEINMYIDGDIEQISHNEQRAIIAIQNGIDSMRSYIAQPICTALLEKFKCHMQIILNNIMVDWGVDIKLNIAYLYI